jgi:hypothetical protein
MKKQFCPLKMTSTTHTKYGEYMYVFFFQIPDLLSSLSFWSLPKPLGQVPWLSSHLLFHVRKSKGKTVDTKFFCNPFVKLID